MLSELTRYIDLSSLLNDTTIESVDQLREFLDDHVEYVRRFLEDPSSDSEVISMIEEDIQYINYTIVSEYRYILGIQIGELTQDDKDVLVELINRYRSNGSIRQLLSTEVHR